MKKKNKVELLIELGRDPIIREIIEHTEEISGNLSSGHKKCTI